MLTSKFLPSNRFPRFYLSQCKWREWYKTARPGALFHALYILARLILIRVYHHRSHHPIPIILCHSTLLQLLAVYPIFNQITQRHLRNKTHMLKGNEKPFVHPYKYSKNKQKKKTNKAERLTEKDKKQKKKVVKFNLKLRLDSLPHSIISFCSSTDQIFKNNHSHKLFLPYWISHHTKNLPVSTSLYISLSQVKKKKVWENIYWKPFSLYKE